MEPGGSTLAMKGNMRPTVKRKKETAAFENNEEYTLDWSKSKVLNAPSVY